MPHLGVIRVDRIETALVLQTEHKYDGIHPLSELKAYTDIHRLHGWQRISITESVFKRAFLQSQCWEASPIVWINQSPILTTRD